MYPIALAVLVGMAVAYATDFILVNVPVIQKIKYLGNTEILFPILTVVVVWATDISILGFYGMGGNLWLDVVGSAFAIVVVSHTLDELSNKLTN